MGSDVTAYLIEPEDDVVEDATNCVMLLNGAHLKAFKVKVNGKLRRKRARVIDSKRSRLASHHHLRIGLLVYFVQCRVASHALDFCLSGSTTSTWALNRFK